MFMFGTLILVGHVNPCLVFVRSHPTKSRFSVSEGLRFLRKLGSLSSKSSLVGLISLISLLGGELRLLGPFCIPYHRLKSIHCS